MPPTYYEADLSPWPLYLNIVIDLSEAFNHFNVSIQTNCPSQLNAYATKMISPWQCTDAPQIWHITSWDFSVNFTTLDAYVKI